MLEKAVLNIEQAFGNKKQDGVLLKPNGRIPDQRSLIEQIFEYVEKNYEKDISLQSIAGMFYTSKEYICRAFKEKYHTNLVKYIHTRRMEKAEMLLSSLEVKVQDIAQMVGYDDFKYFSKLFKRHYSVSPSEYMNARR